MTNQEILKHVDHTLLKAYASWEDIQKLCDEAIQYGTASVCIPACYVKQVNDTYGDKINICTVIGFPLGYSTTFTKVAEAKQAIADGANEVDMVINIGWLCSGRTDEVQKEIATVKHACGNKVLKVIIETCYLNEEQKIVACRAVTNAGADYIKTSTGFGTGGATFEDIELFRKNIGPDVKIKAAGGIKTREDMEKYLELGCDRLGTSSAISILAGEGDNGY